MQVPAGELTSLFALVPRSGTSFAVFASVKSALNSTFRSADTVTSKMWRVGMRQSRINAQRSDNLQEGFARLRAFAPANTPR